MVEFEFRRPGRQCSVEGRPLLPGEEFFSVLTEGDDGSLLRNDVSANAWQGPPEGCVGWWRGRVPDLQKGKVYWAPVEVLLAFFQHAIDHQQHETAWLTALLLLRKRILTWNESCETGGVREMILNCPRIQKEYRIRECVLDESQIRTLQAELAEKLFTDQAESAVEAMETGE